MSNILVQYLEISALLQSVLVYVYYSLMHQSYSANNEFLLDFCMLIVCQTIWDPQGRSLWLIFITSGQRSEQEGDKVLKAGRWRT